MQETQTVHSTFVVERSYPRPPETVFAAFADPVKKQRWFASGPASDLLSYELDFRPGGVERVSARMKPGTPIAGVVLSNVNAFQEITPNRRIVISQASSCDGVPFSATLVTIELLRTASGTDLVCTHQGAFFENSDGPDMRKQGWTFLFESLAKELEAHA